MGSSEWCVHVLVRCLLEKRGVKVGLFPLTAAAPEGGGEISGGEARKEQRAHSSRRLQTGVSILLAAQRGSFTTVTMCAAM